MSETSSYFDLILDIFFNYKEDSIKDVEKMENDFKSIGDKYLSYLSFDYSTRINKIKQGILTNEKFLLDIVNKYKDNHINKNTKFNSSKRLIEINKLRSTLKLFIRDWTIEGKKERDITYIPVIIEIKKYFSNFNNKKILVPGAGLCRLAFEMAKLGCDVDAIEVSYYMLICSDFIFNSNLTLNKYQIQPLIHSFNCLKNENDPFQIFNFPDENINEIMKDTANNIIQFIEIIYNILKQGGIWINIGPLLYHFHDIQNEVSIELSWEEVKKIILKFGFEIKNEKMIDSTYSSVEDRLKTTFYTCIFFTAIKS